MNAQEGRIRTRSEYSAKIPLVGICSEVRTGRYVRLKSGLVRIGSGGFNIPFNTQIINFIYSSFQFLRETV